jgi:ATP-dependent protease ClpP protease subunit
MPNPNKQSWFNVQAAEGDATVGEVSVRGFIGEWGLTDRDFIASVEALGDVATLNVNVNSRGGEIDHAFAIFNFLKAHKARVVVRVTGVAMSSGSIIAMAGDEIIMPANTLMMVHNPWTYTAGSAADLRKEADNLDAFESALRTTYMARTGKNEDEIKALLDDETYMTAAEAVELGFADRVEAIGKRGESASAAVAFASALGIPDDVLAKIEAAEAADVAADDAAQADNSADNSADNAGDSTDSNQAMPASLTDRIVAAATAAGLADYAPAFALDAAIISDAGIAAAIAEAREIAAVCALAGQPAAAGKYIQARKPLAQVRAALLAARAEADEATHTDSHIPTSSSKPPHSEPQAVSTQSIWAARTATHRN